MGAATRLALALGCLALVVALGGCGGDSGSSTDTAAATGDAATSTATGTAPGTAAKGSKQAEPSEDSSSGESGEEESFTPKPHHDSGGGSSQFEVKGGDNSVQEFGEEAGGSELDEAAEALHGFFDARAAGAWQAACSYLSASMVAQLHQLSATSKQLENADCAGLLEALSEGVPASALAEAAEADVGSLRLEADQAFLLYRGAEDAVYAISMQKEGGSWRVDALSGTPVG